MGQGTISIVVIGGISYVKGNTDGLESLAGLSSSQAAEAADQWIQFSTDNTAFAPVVEGVRSTDIAKELALKAPLSLGKTRTLNGESVDAIDGTQTFGKKSQRVVLYVRASGTHVPVEEDSVDSKGEAHRRRAHHLLEVGRAGTAQGAHRNHLGRLDKRRLRKRPDDGGPRRGRGKMDLVRHPGQVGASAPQCRASKRVKVMHPLRHSTARTAAVATGLAAAAALALAAPAGAASTTTTTAGGSAGCNGEVQRGPEGGRIQGRALLLGRQAERRRARRLR